MGGGQLGKASQIQEEELQLPVLLCLLFSMNTYNLTYLEAILNLYTIFLFFLSSTTILAKTEYQISQSFNFLEQFYTNRVNICRFNGFA